MLKITIQNKQVYYGEICPYCKSKPEFVDSIVVYGKSYGMIYLCRPCKAWVGVHAGTDRPLGRLANATLRNLKKEAHKYFDRLWQSKNPIFYRTAAYKWLSIQLGIPKHYTHIGMFSEETCLKVITLSKDKLNERSSNTNTNTGAAKHTAGN